VLGLDRSTDDGQSEVDDAEQATAVVMDELQAMVAENDNQPVPRDGLVWRVGPPRTLSTRSPRAAGSWTAPTASSRPSNPPTPFLVRCAER